MRDETLQNELAAVASVKMLALDLADFAEPLRKIEKTGDRDVCGR